MPAPKDNVCTPNIDNNTNTTRSNENMPRFITIPSQFKRWKLVLFVTARIQMQTILNSSSVWNTVPNWVCMGLYKMCIYW